MHATARRSQELFVDNQSVPPGGRDPRERISSLPRVNTRASCRAALRCAAPRYVASRRASNLPCGAMTTHSPHPSCRSHNIEIRARYHYPDAANTRATYIAFAPAETPLGRATIDRQLQCIHDLADTCTFDFGIRFEHAVLDVEAPADGSIRELNFWEFIKSKFSHRTVSIAFQATSRKKYSNRFESVRRERQRK